MNNQQQKELIMSRATKQIIKVLTNCSSAKNAKSGYQQGHYDLESAVMECLDLIDNDAHHYVKTEAIMHFLHRATKQ